MIREAALDELISLISSPSTFKCLCIVKFSFWKRPSEVATPNPDHRRGPSKMLFASIDQFLNKEISFCDLMVLVIAKTFKPVARLSFSCLGGLAGYYGFNGLGAAALGSVFGFFIGYDISTQFHDRLLVNRMREIGVYRNKKVNLNGIYGGRCF